MEVEIDDETEAEADLADYAAAGVLSSLPGEIGARVLRSLQLLGDPGTLRAALPFDLEVR